MAPMKININLQKWIFQIGWIIINAIRVILRVYIETLHLNVNMEMEMVYCGIFVDRSQKILHYVRVIGLLP